MTFFACLFILADHRTSAMCIFDSDVFKFNMSYNINHESCEPITTGIIKKLLRSLLIQCTEWERGDQQYSSWKTISGMYSCERVVALIRRGHGCKSSFQTSCCAYMREGKLLLCKCGGCWKLRTPPNLTINERDIHTDREGEGYSDCEPGREMLNNLVRVEWGLPLNSC